MINTPDRRPQIARQPFSDRVGRQRPGRLSAAAGSAFLKALGADLVLVAAQLRAALARLGRGRGAGKRARAPAGGSLTAAAHPRRSRAHSGWRSLRRVVLALALVAIATVAVVSGALLWAVLGLPVGPSAGLAQPPALLLESASGAPLGRIGPLRVADVPLSEFPPVLINAVLSVEDRRFFSHPGIDPRGILRAALANRAAGEIIQGASTITQQLVKLEYLTDDRSYVFKLRQALLAMRLETHLSKDEILDRYLNRVYLGEGAVGMAAAARVYFGKPPQALDLAEAAMLAGLIRAPSQFDPLRHPRAAAARAATVLDAMVATHVVDAAAAAAAKARPAVVRSSPELAPARSWFADWVTQPAAKLAGRQSKSVRVRTTLMPDLQSLAQHVLDQTLDSEGARLGIGQGALVAMRPDGAVVAMVGGRNYRDSEYNRAAASDRQPGSAFKLFVYLAALRQGYTPQDTIDGGPIDINGWEPGNFDDEHYGRITLAEAFAKSVNTAAVRLAMKVGLGNVIAAARDLGLTEPLPKVPSLALGTAGVSLVDMTGAFASVMADHMPVRPWAVAAIGAGDGQWLLATVPAVPPQTLEPYQQPLVALLQGVIAHGTGRAAALDGFAAGKTGTSQDYRDAWFFGFNDALVVGVWLGNDDDSPMKRVVGGSLPAEIWKQFITRATPIYEAEKAGVVAASAAVPAAGAEAATGAGGSGPLCDPVACLAKYHSFRAADCTYQPYGGGPRQLCELGAAQSNADGSGGPSVAAAVSGSSTEPTLADSSGAPEAPAQCHVEACAGFYSSFDPANCTYQPYGGGGRQLCLK